MTRMTGPDCAVMCNLINTHTHLPSAVPALIFLARRIQPFLSLVDGEVKFLCTNEPIVLHLLGICFLGVGGVNPSSCDCTGIRTHVSTSESFEVTN